MASLQSYLMMAAGAATALVILAVILGVGQDMLSNVQDSQCTGYASGCTDGGVNSTAASNITLEGMQGLDKLSSNQSTLAIIVVAAVLIGVLFVAFPRM